MNAPARAASASSLHPVLWVAAVSVTAFSAVGIARMSGFFEPATPAPVVAATVQTGTTPAAVPQAVNAAPEPAQPAAAADKPAEKRSEKHVVKAVAAKKVHVADAGEAGAVKVADRTYDSGIDVIPAQPRTAYEQTLPRSEADYRAPAPVCADCGLVESVREVKAPADPSGLGAAAGGVVGGLLGNQVGKGSGRTIATLIGIAGGAYAGHQVEKTQRTSSRWEVGVRMENGEYRTVTLDAEPVWRAGDKVRLQGNRLVMAD
ncbi:MAG: glycine zipper 2TM domain-containing protein [Methyloversatilis sp.]|nr:glycine zipper 2TM domain-containing protein [Methyloversatilis sp.]